MPKGFVGKGVEIKRDRGDLISANGVEVESVDCAVDTSTSLSTKWKVEIRSQHRDSGVKIAVIAPAAAVPFISSGKPGCLTIIIRALPAFASAI
jgi:hypothetical protein